MTEGTEVDYVTAILTPMREEMEHIAKARGVSDKLDRQIEDVVSIYRRATLSVRQGDGFGFLVYKFHRAANWTRFEFGHRLVKCGACAGSGYYDNDGSPDCGACDGSGKDWEPGEHAFQRCLSAGKSGG